MFTLHPQLANDTVGVSENESFALLLVNDARYPWLILVPKQEGVREIHELSDEAQIRLLNTSSTLGRELMQLFSGEKFNVAALGNQVPQLHVHHIVRHAKDFAWPRPVWGEGPAEPYSTDALRERMALLRKNLTFVTGQILPTH